MKSPQMSRTLALLAILLAGSTAVFAAGAHEENGPVELTVATVNNPDMLIMQQLSARFTRSSNTVSYTHLTLPTILLV